MTAVEQLSRLLADRSLVDAVLGDHPSNDPSLPPAETFLVHGCGLLAETLALLGGGVSVALHYNGEILHAALRHRGGYLDADGWSDEATLRRRWAEIVECEPDEIEIGAYDAAAAAWFRAADPELDARVERFADELVRRDARLIAALRAAD